MNNNLFVELGQNDLSEVNGGGGPLILGIGAAKLIKWGVVLVFGAGFLRGCDTAERSDK